MRLLMLSVILLAIAAAGCGPNVQGIVAELAKSKRSWCFYWAGTPAFSGPFRISGSGIEAEGEGSAGADCNAEKHIIGIKGAAGQGQDGALQAPGAVVTPGGDVILRAAPRVWLEGPPEYEQVDPQTLRRKGR